MNTLLTYDYGVRLPFVGVASGLVATPSLVAALSNAGGIGVLDIASKIAAQSRADIQLLKRSTSELFGVNLHVEASAGGPLGAGTHLDVCIAEQVRLVVFHAKVPRKAWVDRLHAAGARVWMCATSVEQAVAAAAIGVDAVVAQERDAGAMPSGPPAARWLLRQIVRQVSPVMVLAAGNIIDGASAFEALHAGAEGVWVDVRVALNTGIGKRHENPAYVANRIERRLA